MFLQTEDATTLRETFSNGEKDFAALEKYHRMMYDTCKEYYEKLLDVEVTEAERRYIKRILHFFR